MAVMWANAGAMPARSPYLNSTLESLRKLKSAFATPLPHAWRSSSSQTLFSGNVASVTTRIAAASSRFGPELDGSSGTDPGEKKVSRLHALSPLGDQNEEEHAESRSKHFDKNFPPPELKSSWTRPRPGEADLESISRTKWSATRTAENNRSSIKNFNNSKAAFRPNLVPRNNNGGGALGNKDSKFRGSGGSRSVAENDLVEEQTTVAFESWAKEKLREAGTPALSAIEEMRQTLAPGSLRLGSQSVSSAIQPEGNIVVERNHNYGDMVDPSRVNHQVSSSSSPSSRFAAGRSEQLVARSSTMSDTWSPKSMTTSRGSRSAPNMASRTGVQFPAEESGKTRSGESTSASRSDDASTPQPLVVKRNTKFPINFYGREGTVMLVDKPKGWTSFAICGKLRHLLKIQKVGHAGTLDPMATGLLIVCLGKATKLADSYQALTKVYSGTLRLGELTPSLDADTEVSDVLPWEHITDDQLEQAKQEFIGDIFQTPPMYSAIKVDGERLYTKARKGEEIEVPPRLVTVIDFQLERSSENRQDIHFKVTSSKGTYIRSLCADLARAVGSYAHLTALRRERIGTYSVEDAWPIKEFVEKYTRSRLRAFWEGQSDGFGSDQKEMQ